MDPSFMQEICGFRAVSGNHVIRVVDLGADGMTACWQNRPSRQDLEELATRARSKLGPHGTVAIHLAGVGEVGLERSRQAYAAWKKTGKIDGSTFHD